MSRLTQWHLDNWTDADFKAHTPAVRNTIAQLERDLAEARAERDRLKRENHDLGNEIDSLEEEGCDADDTIRKLEAERDRLAAELAEERARPKLKIKRVERQPLVVDEPAWPNGCYSLSSCSRHLACMYHGCRHEGRNVKPEIEVAIAARASLQTGEKQG